MSYENEVRNTLSSMETDELIERIKRGTLTDEAFTVAKEILSSRGVEIANAVNPQSQESSSPSITFRQKIKWYFLALIVAYLYYVAIIQVMGREIGYSIIGLKLTLGNSTLLFDFLSKAVGALSIPVLIHYVSLKSWRSFIKKASQKSA